MATAQPQPANPTQQLALPLTPHQQGQLIACREVWTTLSPQQQAQFFQQIVRICCHLIRTKQPAEVRDE